MFEVLQEKVAVRVANEGAGRDADDRVFAVLAGHQRALAMLAAAGPPMLVSHEVGKTADVFIGFDDHVTPLTAVAPVGTAAGHAGFAAKAQATGATVAGDTMNC